MFVAIPLDRLPAIIQAIHSLPSAWSKAAHFSATRTIAKVISPAPTVNAARHRIVSYRFPMRNFRDTAQVTRSIGSKFSLAKYASGANAAPNY
jgi:hypothetical protein